MSPCHCIGASVVARVVSGATSFCRRAWRGGATFRRTLAVSFAWFGVIGAAFAAHPLITEDTGTQGAGRFEFENGFQWASEGDVRAFEYGPQVSYGVLDNLDLIVRPTWLEQRRTASAGGGVDRGPGNTALDVKWRFHEAGAWSFGTRAGVNVPTGDADKGLGTRTVGAHALAIATLDAAPYALHANFGYAHDRSDGERSSRWLASVAAVWSAHERAKLTLDIAAASNSDPQRATWPAVVRAGTIVTIVEGFDVDVGYQTRLNRSAPEHVLLVGATFRW